MTSVLIGAGLALALVLALQISIYRRLIRIPARTAEHVRLEILNRARADADALKESTAKSVGEIVKSLNQHHDRAQRYQFDLTENYRNEIAALQARAREREAHANIFADLVAVLREVTRELRELRDDDDQRKTREAIPPAETRAAPRVPDRRPPPVPRVAPPISEVDDQGDPDARKTVESPPPATSDDELEEEPTTVAPRSHAASRAGVQR